MCMQLSGEMNISPVQSISTSHPNPVAQPAEELGQSGLGQLVGAAQHWDELDCYRREKKEEYP